MSNIPPVEELPLERPSIPITYQPRPKGTPGRKPPRGYNYQELFKLIRNHYAYLLHITHLALASTRGIDISKTIERQAAPGLITKVILKILKEVPEFDIFQYDGYWSIRALIYIVLKSSADKHRQVQRALALANKTQAQDKPSPRSDEESQLNNGVGQTPGNQPSSNQQTKESGNGTGGSGNKIAPTATESATASTNSTPATTTTPRSVEVEVHVEAVTNYVPPPAATNDEATCELVVGLGSIVLDSLDDVIGDGDASMRNVDHDVGHDAGEDAATGDEVVSGSRFFTDDFPAQVPPAPPSMLEAVMSLSESEIAKLPLILRLAVAGFGGTPNACPITSQLVAQTSNSVPTTITAPAPGSAPAPDPVVLTESTPAINPRSPANTAASAPTVQSTTTSTTSASTKPKLPVTGLFDDDGTLSDTPSEDMPRRLTRARKKEATQSVETKGAASSAGKGGGKAKKGGGGSTTAKGCNSGKVPANTANSDEHPVIATGTRRTRKT
ncbi:hypothetical protein RSOLAG22IIIB_10234 [Rhizoctonia solani]|uniref:Uncharacterized protein n=1 Tax=Rhizoctonia solani TaxID=456999 RepID=A0A0K6G2V4_9AGAM|nr:hypothetical protein RSOLAG22IIIB_10234 [Rhizoctonia solani]